MIVYLKNIILLVGFYCCLVLPVKANNDNNDSTIKYKNEIEVGIGGAANIIKTSFLRNIYLNEKFILAPRIGLSTLGFDLKFKIIKSLNLVMSNRILALFWHPVGKPVPFNKIYDPWEEYEPGGLYNALGSSVSLGLNYTINGVIIGANTSINSIFIFNRSRYKANDVFSIGISVGYKFKSFKK
jgi:hypothetical protein